MAKNEFPPPSALCPPPSFPSSSLVTHFLEALLRSNTFWMLVRSGASRIWVPKLELGNQW